jgi:hypothetical protein
MGRVENTRTYIKHYLPAEITSRMDMDTLEVDIEGYVDDDLIAERQDQIDYAVRNHCHYQTGSSIPGFNQQVMVRNQGFAT